EPGGLVAFVLQGLHQAGDLLPEVSQLRYPAELGRVAGCYRYTQAAEDQAHAERKHDHRDEPPGYRPVPQGQHPRALELGRLRFPGVLAGFAAVRSAARQSGVSHDTLVLASYVSSCDELPTRMTNREQARHPFGRAGAGTDE